jgi:hypothetical protein
VACDSEFLMLFSSTEMLLLTDNDDLAWVDLFMCVMINTSMSSGGDGDVSKVLLLHHILL